MADSYMSLHVAEPRIGGPQTAYEATCAGYERVAYDGGTVEFPECTGGETEITHFAIDTAKDGEGEVLVVG